MSTIGFEALHSEIRAINPTCPIGRVSSIGSNIINVTGVSDVGALGDLVVFQSKNRPDIRGEIIRLEPDHATVLPDGSAAGLQIGDEAKVVGQEEIAPHASWLGRVIDPYGCGLDDRPILRGAKSIPLRGKPMNPTERRPLGERLETGMRVFNTMLPLVRGQRIGLFAGSGIGKSTLLARFAMGVETDVVVIALIGERGREVREFVERVLGPEGMKRAVVVAATSDTSPMVRRRCAWAAMAVAEYFRDEGNQVLLLADSVTRFADAHREISVSGGEQSGLRGYPASTTQLITGLCERAGPGSGYAGDITAVFSVLVAGSDMEEPIADTLRGVLDGHVLLDRKIAERGRFPAIDLLKSVSRSLPDAADQNENQLIATARHLLGVYEKAELMVQSGLYAAGTDKQIDTAISVFPSLDEFVATRESKNTQASFQALAMCLGIKQ